VSTAGALALPDPEALADPDPAEPEVLADPEVADPDPEPLPLDAPDEFEGLSRFELAQLTNDTASEAATAATTHR